MYAYINGTVAYCDLDTAVLDVNGVGYSLRVSMATISKLTVGKPVRLYTHLHVREDIFDLYGFYSQDERGCFLQLLSISGVGPKAALNVLSAVTPEQLALAVLSGDDKALTRAAGVGTKLAQRIILELKNSTVKRQAAFSAAAPDAAAVSDGGIAALRDAQSALVVLGYSPSEAMSALKGVGADRPVEEMIRFALTKMG
jgi:Holliday junction DNA helicase RuvA